MGWGTQDTYVDMERKCFARNMYINVYFFKLLHGNYIVYIEQSDQENIYIYV